MEKGVISIDAVLLDFNQKIVGHALNKTILDEWMETAILKTGIYYNASLYTFLDGSQLVMKVDFMNKIIVL